MNNQSIFYINNFNKQFVSIFKDKKFRSNDKWTKSDKWSDYSGDFIFNLFRFIFFEDKSCITIGYKKNCDINFAGINKDLRMKDIKKIFKEIIMMINFECFDYVNLKFDCNDNKQYKIYITLKC